MRVAIRRARSALHAFGAIIEREVTRPLCEKLKWLAAALGRARDDEVLLARLTACAVARKPARLLQAVELLADGRRLGEALRSGGVRARARGEH
jgi:CHAD domain-containing protein